MIFYTTSFRGTIGRGNKKTLSSKTEYVRMNETETVRIRPERPEAPQLVFCGLLPFLVDRRRRGFATASSESITTCVRRAEVFREHFTRNDDTNRLLAADCFWDFREGCRRQPQGMEVFGGGDEKEDRLRSQEMDDSFLLRRCRSIVSSLFSSRFFRVTHWSVL